MPEGSRESFSSYAETNRSNFKVILHSYNYITNITDEISLRLLRMRWTPFRLSVCLARYCSKYTNRKTVDQRKSKFTKQEDSYCKCDQFCVDTFSLPVSLAATGAVPIPIPRALTRFCRFSFVACRDVHHLLFLIFEWMDHLVADDACYIIHALFSDRLLVSSWCLGSSRSKCGIAFVWSDSAVRIVRAHQCFTMVAG